MQYHYKWEVDHGPQIVEEVERPEDWGTSFFYYCRRCRFTYATIELKPSDGSNRIWGAVRGLCNNCPGDRWTIPGSLECPFTVGWHVPEPIVKYQLERELAFLTHAQHPYQEDQ